MKKRLIAGCCEEARAVRVSRDEFVEIAKPLNIELPKNPGDAIYSFRFRNVLPSEILATAGKDREWVIELAGRARYRFRLANIVPNPSMIAIKIPDATPEILWLTL